MKHRLKIALPRIAMLAFAIVASGVLTVAFIWSQQEPYSVGPHIEEGLNGAGLSEREIQEQEEAREASLEQMAIDGELDSEALEREISKAFAQLRLAEVQRERYLRSTDEADESRLAELERDIAGRTEILATIESHR